MFYLWYPAAAERQKEINQMINKQHVPEDWEDEMLGLFQRALFGVRDIVARRALKMKQPHLVHQRHHGKGLSQDAAKALLTAASHTKR